MIVLVADEAGAVLGYTYAGLEGNDYIDTALARPACCTTLLWIRHVDGKVSGECCSTQRWPRL